MSPLSIKKTEYTQGKAYSSIIFVVFFWGSVPIIINSVLDYFSATVYSAISSTFSVIYLLLICRKDLGEINGNYLKIAIPTGLFMSTAELIQKIGLPFTTPANYAFLENLSCVVVPILVFILTKKKPSLLTVFSSILCLVSAFILSGINLFNFKIGIGDLLCAIAGILFAFNIAGTGVFSRNLKASLYILIQLCVNAVLCWFSSILLSQLKIDGNPIVPFKFTLAPIPLLIIAVNALVSGVICWILRTKAMRKINPTAVAVIMPFSAVVTSVISVIIGTDALTTNLIVGGSLCLVASLLSGVANSLESKKG